MSLASTNQAGRRCVCCGAPELAIFYTARRAPVQSMLLLDSSEEALAFPTGDITLGFCGRCGFITNMSFDQATQEYSEKYEASQGFSPTFNAFHQRLALQLIDRYRLRNRRVIEIGCGQGEFLTLLCELGNNRGLGFDPVFSPGRAQLPPGLDLTIVDDLYSERYADQQADLICCKMTLEHLPDPSALIGTIRRAIGGNTETVVFFQIPNVRPILHDGAFWEIYYEHCSYFSPGALARLFRRCGFTVSDLWTDYDDQYLMVEARPSTGPSAPSPLPIEESPEELAELVARFSEAAHAATERWRERLRGFGAAGKRVVLWGSGSRGVGFLASIAIDGVVSAVVDINPYRQGKFMAGTGQPIIAPQALRAEPPDAVIIMNPIYREEIRRDLEQLGLSPELLAP
jgi:SAM-dependent methyltransferase